MASLESTGRRLIAAAAALLMASAAEARPVGRKYIAHGWDLLHASPEEILENADAFDRTALDGVTICLSRNVPGFGTFSHAAIMTDSHWPWDGLKSTAKVLRAIAMHPSLKSSFLSCWLAPRRRFAWNDDSDWKRAAGNLAVAARLAKAGGLEGLLFDREDYPRTRQYRHLPGDPPFAETMRLARRRGAEVGRAVFREFPEVRLLFFQYLITDRIYETTEDPEAYRTGTKDLWPSFVNGMLDVAPPEVRFIEGDECAYEYKAEKGDFDRIAARQLTGMLPVVAPSNRGKYRAQTSVGFGLYLDAYVVDESSRYYKGPVDGSRAAHFGVDLEGATRACDEYVWIYGETYDWIPWKKRPEIAWRKQIPHGDEVATWADRLPEFDLRMRAAKDGTFRVGRLIEKARRSGGANLFPETLPQTWADENLPAGSFALDGRTGCGSPPSFRASGVGCGCFLKPFGVTPGEQYAIAVATRGEGGLVTVMWKHAGKWRWDIPGRHVASSEKLKDGWTRLSGTVIVPEGATEMVVQLNVRQDADETAWFDDVWVYRIGACQE